MINIKKVVLLLLSTGSLVVCFNNCDGIKRPSVARTMSSVSFNHEGITANCTSCHGTGKTFGCYPAGHVATNGQDCGACHNTFSWQTGASPHGPGMPTPTTCISCHSAARPAGTVGSASLVNNLTPVGGLFDHASGPGAGDCVSCHSANPDNIGVSWAGGVFGHSPVPSTCINCHTSVQRPVGSVGTPPYDHAVNGTGDCVSCHSTPAVNVGRTWQQGKFGHTPTPMACATCHASDTQYTAIQNIIKNQMAHTFAGMPDCAKCHASTSMASSWTTWIAEVGVTNGVSTARATVGVFHANFGSNPTSCTACHVNERPVGPAGASGFDHAANGGLGECASCHLAVPANVGKTWAGGGVVHTGFTACASCHKMDLPAAGTVVPNTRDGFNHDMKYGTECFACHTVVKANVGVKWANGFFGHNNNNAASFTNCSPCHATRQSKGDHTNRCGDPYCATTNCANCHRITWPAPNANGTYGGKFGGG